MKSVLVAVLVAFLIAGCSSSHSSSTMSSAATSSSGDFAMSMSFDPSPPKQGNETITISVKDASGSAIKGATLSSTTTMPAMSMSGPLLTFQDKGDGTYSAVTNLNYGTKWVFDVSASQGGKSGKAEFTADVP